MFSSRLGLALLAGLLALVSCTAEHQPPVERLAVLTAENLTPDPSLDWVGHAIAAIVSARLLGSATVHAVSLDTPRAATNFRATQVLYSYFDAQDGGLRLRAVLRDARRMKPIRVWELQTTVPEGVGEVAGQLAGSLIESPRSFGTRDPEAIRHFGQALAAKTLEDRRTALRAAIQIAPEFAEPLLALAQLESGAGHRDQARKLLEGLPSAGVLDAITAARRRVLLASLEDDPAERAAALEAWSALVPADSDSAVRTAGTLLLEHRYADAAEWYGRAGRLEPDRAELWNSQAYPRAYAGDFSGAVESLERYRAADPSNVNALDSLGEIHFRFGKLKAAEQYFLDTYDTDPDFQGSVALVKAARCRLLRGDRAGADELFDEYAGDRRLAKDPSLDYHRSQWLYWTGRQDEARELLLGVAQGEAVPPAIVMLARCQLALWALVEGDRDAAATHVDRALRLTGGQAVSQEAAIARFLIEPARQPAGWKRAAERLFAHPSQAGLRRNALIYALLLGRHFHDALPLLEEAVRSAPPFTEDVYQVLLAWTLIETGEPDRARELLATNPIIQPGAESVFYGLIFPRILFLRGSLAMQNGASEAASSNLRMFLEYSGQPESPTPEQQTAREMLAALGN